MGPYEIWQEIINGKRPRGEVVYGYDFFGSGLNYSDFEALEQRGVHVSRGGYTAEGSYVLAAGVKVMDLWDTKSRAGAKRPLAAFDQVMLQTTFDALQPSILEICGERVAGQTPQLYLILTSYEVPFLFVPAFGGGDQSD